MQRRTILAAAALLAAPLLAIQAFRQREEEFVFASIPGVPGFRRLDAGRVSDALGDPFIGLRVPDAPPAPVPLPLEELCAILFGSRDLPDGTVPIASFSDYYCPYCRDLTVRLAARSGQGLRISWHELPLLGTASEAAARASLAADLQGAYPEFQARLLRAAFQPTEAYLRELAQALGLDTARLLDEAKGEEVARRLHTSARAAATLGIGATPALVVGRTLVTGAIQDDRLDALIELERAAGPPGC